MPSRRRRRRSSMRSSARTSRFSPKSRSLQACGRTANNRSNHTHREGDMRIHNLYTDEKGESHFRDIEIEWAEERRGSKLSKRLPANGIIFRETVGEYDLSWHPAPRRQ